MKCSSRSTTCRGKAVVLVLALLLGVVPGAAGATDTPDAETPVRLALLQAVRARMGETAAVDLADLTIHLTHPLDGRPLVATPDPGSRVGRAVRFSLGVADGASRPRTVGRAVAVVRVAVAHARAAAAVSRGAVLDDTDLAEVNEDVGVVALAPLPRKADATGCRALRDLVAGERLTPGVLRAEPLVKAGDTVRIIVRVGAVEAEGEAVAQQSGHRHDRIRLINPVSRRPLTGRVTGRGEVEVLHVR